MDGEASENRTAAAAEVAVSYSSRDRTQVVEFVEQLRQAGVSVWIDYGSIDGALLWHQEIADAIEACKALVLFASAASLSSPHVVREVSLALDMNKPILPVFLEATEIPRSLRYQLTGIQHIKFHSGDPSETYAAVLRSLSRLGVEIRKPIASVRAAPEEPSSVPLRVARPPVPNVVRPRAPAGAAQRVHRRSPGVGHEVRAGARANIEAAGRSSRGPWKIAAASILLVVAVVIGFLQLAPERGSDGSTLSDHPSTTASTAAAGSGTPVSLPTPVTGASITGETPCPNVDGSSPRTTAFAKAPPTCIDAGRAYAAEMQTSKGLITITLDADSAPLTVNNFVVLARYHFFDTLPFHRIVRGFVVQGGSPDATGAGGPGYRFADELPPADGYELGAVAMANSGADTNGSQFFIVSGDPSSLAPSYTLFGEVTAGLDVVRDIDAAGLPGSDSDAGKPTEVVTIQSVVIQES